MFPNDMAIELSQALGQGYKNNPRSYQIYVQCFLDLYTHIR